MTKAIIGTNAGLVYQLLCDRVHWSYESLKNASHLTDRELCTALGWLAREDKIEYEPTPEGFKVYLSDCFYF